jgi:hypothetical protein
MNREHAASADAARPEVVAQVESIRSLLTEVIGRVATLEQAADRICSMPRPVKDERARQDLPHAVLTLTSRLSEVDSMAREALERSSALVERLAKLV